MLLYINTMNALSIHTLSPLPLAYNVVHQHFYPYLYQGRPRHSLPSY